ncbi:MAG: YaeQ family protein, partial [Halioglobus sp.]|nr:YaeQ family protein [Halioglobus sp.]
FTKGISTADEPDLWVHSDSGEIEQWIEAGHPEELRLRKACGRARKVSVYAFAKSTPTWWKVNNAAISALPHLEVWLLDWLEIQSAADLLNRTVHLNVSIVGGILYLDNGSTSTSVEPILLCQTD